VEKDGEIDIVMNSLLGIVASLIEQQRTGEKTKPLNQFLKPLIRFSE